MASFRAELLSSVSSMSLFWFRLWLSRFFDRILMNGFESVEPLEIRETLQSRVCKVLAGSVDCYMVLSSRAESVVCIFVDVCSPWYSASKVPSVGEPPLRDLRDSVGDSLKAEVLLIRRLLFRDLCCRRFSLMAY